MPERHLDQLTPLYRDHLAEVQRRHERALAATGFDALLIHSGSPKKRTEFDDQYFALRPTPQFQHLVPLAEPDCALLVRPGHAPLLFWLHSTSFWEQPAPLESEHFRAAVEVVDVSAVDEIRRQLPAIARLAYVGEEVGPAQAFGVAAAGINPPELLRQLDALRVHKTPYEVFCLAEANRRAALGHHAVRRRFLEGDASELDLHLAFLSATAQDDPETPYKNIVALGEHAATLHHISYSRQRPQRPGESLLLDAGSTYQGYCSDITRTWVRGRGAAVTAFAQLVEGVERMQQQLCAAVRVGLPYEALHDQSHRLLSQLLHDLGLVRSSPEAIEAQGVSRVFFPHGLGHSLGLTCHDVGCATIKPRADNPFLRNTSVIAEDQVFTIEPGVYFIEALLGPLRAGPQGADVDWELCRQLASLGGVRIEDDLHVTGGGPGRNLTRERLPLGGGLLS